MSFKACIDAALKQNELSKDEADELLESYDSLVRQLGETLGQGEARAQAKARLAENLVAEKARRKRQAILTLKVTERILSEMAAHRNARGELDPADYLIKLLERHHAGDFSSVEGRRHAILAMTDARMGALLDEFRRSAVFGRVKNKARLENVVRELFGEDTGDAAAKALAKAWAEVSEDLRQRFNRGGGAIGKRQDWGLPQTWNRIAVARFIRAEGAEAFKKRLMDSLAPERMTHPLANRPMTRSEVAESLDHVIESILSEGWNTRAPSRAPQGRGALANQRLDHRFLVFKSADAWLAVQRDFGMANPWATMMQHVNLMARDIAALEILGPNPDATLRWLMQTVEQQAALRASGEAARFPAKHPVTGRQFGVNGAQDYARSSIRRAEDMWAHMRGSAETPVNTFWANAIDGARNIVTSAVLGAASITALSDIAFQKVARTYAGLPVMNSVVADIARQFRPSERREAVAAGLILESAHNVLHRQARYVGTLTGPEWTRYLADRVLTWSGLTPWTQAARHAFGMSFQRETAVRLKMAFESLPKALRETFERHGLSGSDWRALQLARLYSRRGASFLRPSEIAAIADGRDWQRAADIFGIEHASAGARRELTRQRVEALAERYLEMIHAEMEFAVPSGTVRGRSVLLGNAQAGTFGGAVARSFSQFKSFSVVMLLLHAGRVGADLSGGRIARGAAYAGGLLAGSTMLGALSLQLKDISKGRDPRPMNTPEFWGGALLQGGGLGIYGDFFFGELNRFGGGIASTLAGPLADRGTDVLNLTVGNMAQLLAGKETNFKREAVNFLSKNTPGASIWYARLAWERLIFDQLHWLADPAAYQTFRRKERFFRNQFDQGFWFRPGETRPDRAPDLSNALGR